MGSTHYLQDGNNKRLAMGRLGSVPREVMIVTPFRAVVYALYSASVFSGDPTAWSEATDGFVVYKLEKTMTLSKFKALPHLYQEDVTESTAAFNTLLKQA